MGFGVWFHEWVAVIFALLFGKERGKNKFDKRSSRPSRRAVLKKKTKRRSRARVKNSRMLDAVLNFLALTVGILLLFPFGLISFGHKNAKIRAERRASKSVVPRTAGAKAPVKTAGAKAPVKTSGKAADRSDGAQDPARGGKSCSPDRRSESSAKQGDGRAAEEPKTVKAKDLTPDGSAGYAVRAEVRRAAPEIQPDPDAPRSTPLSATDEYIRRRMKIADPVSDFDGCFTDLIGHRIDFSRASGSAFWGDIDITLGGKRIGAVASEDKILISVALDAKRRVYGIITDAARLNGSREYEYEAWLYNGV